MPLHFFLFFMKLVPESFAAFLNNIPYILSCPCSLTKPTPAQPVMTPDLKTYPSSLLISHPSLIPNPVLPVSKSLENYLWKPLYFSAFPTYSEIASGHSVTTHLATYQLPEIDCCCLISFSSLLIIHPPDTYLVPFIFQTLFTYNS